MSDSSKMKDPPDRSGGIINDTLESELLSDSERGGFKMPEAPSSSSKSSRKKDTNKKPKKPVGRPPKVTHASESETDEGEMANDKLIKKIKELTRENRIQSEFIAKLNEKIEQMFTRMSEMEKRIGELDSKEDHPQPSTAQIPWSSVVSKWASKESREKKPPEQQIQITNSILKENLERESKKQNLIVLGIKPSESDDKTKQKEEDESQLRKIFDKIGIDHKSIKTFWRFKPKPESKNHPPILIKLNENVNRVDVLIASKKLSKINEYKNVFINLDLTVYQRDEEKKLRDERNRLNKLEADGNQPFRWGIRHRSSGERLVRYKIDGGSN